MHPSVLVSGVQLQMMSTMNLSVTETKSSYGGQNTDHTHTLRRRVYMQVLLPSGQLACLGYYDLGSMLGSPFI